MVGCTVLVFFLCWAPTQIFLEVAFPLLNPTPSVDVCVYPICRCVCERERERERERDPSNSTVAIAFAKEAHYGQLRKTGEPYLTHCIHTGRILAALVPSSGKRVRVPPLQYWIL